jgi:hypothetical protein
LVDRCIAVQEDTDALPKDTAAKAELSGSLLGWSPEGDAALFGNLEEPEKEVSPEEMRAVVESLGGQVPADASELGWGVPDIHDSQPDIYDAELDGRVPGVLTDASFAHR